MALKKGSFRMMHRNQWRWCRANKIRGNTLLVLLAIETGPWGAGQYTGVFHLAVSDIMQFTGLKEAEVSLAIESLERLGAIIFDQEKVVVFVRGMLARQSPSFASSENNLLGISNHVERMPEGSPAVRAFIEAQRNIPELFELLEGYLEGESEGYLEGESEGYLEGEAKGRSKGTSNRPEDLKTLIPEDLRPEDKETVIAEKSPATTPSVQPSSSSPDSTPDLQVKCSPLGSPSTSTPGKSKSTASGKVKPGNGNGTARASSKEGAVKIAALEEVARLVRIREIDLAQASERLRASGFSSAEINSPGIMSRFMEATH